MKISINPYSVKLWLSEDDTASWARDWPCSELSDRRVFAEFDRNGLLDLAIDGGRGSQDVSNSELTAITSDFLREKLPANHPAYFVAVGQFA